MVVMLATTLLGVRRAVVTVDGHGTRAASGWGVVEGVRPGRIVTVPEEDGEQEGPGVWVLAVDPVVWPLRARDVIVEPSTGREWTVTKAKLQAHAVERSVDWVRAEAFLR
ncbi:hypothetical protein [Nonomuraea dietziae]|uniref:hypothetical protein n=1 Tax=Nonomuraea dietziae TaxID=65515 RepID=UPI0033DD7513